MKCCLRLLLTAILTLPNISALAQPQRQTVPLPDGWKFLRHDAAPDAAVSAEWQAVSVPHCWNALDGQTGKTGKAAHPEFKDGYYRGPAWYQRTLDIPADWRDRRVFIRFGAAFLVADVYLNGEHLGQHRGGFAAFCYELTGKLKFGGANELRVRVDNSRNEEVAPLSADFTMEGGLYRPVQLLVTDKTCITPLDYAGPGVYVTPKNVSAEGADIEVEIKLDSTEPAGSAEWSITSIVEPAIDYQAEIKKARAAGSKLLNLDHSWGDAQQTTKDVAPSGSVRQLLHLKNPHLWDGIKAPYLYSVDVDLMRRDKGANKAVWIDHVTVPLGLRTLVVDQEKGFLLNGQRYPIHGVNRHQEKRDQGWALSDADQDADFQTIREMGTTAVRLAHYQQAEHVHDIADQAGLLLWQEVPLVNEIGPSDAFADNAKQQLTEMIRQGYNHPSIMTWSTFNELYNVKTTPPCEPLITALDKLARELDPTRIPGGVSDHQEKTALNRIPEWIGYNDYPGWYGKDVEKLPRDVRKFVDGVGGKRIALTEYGAGANPTQHQEGAPVEPQHAGPFHPEEWQSFVHERHWAQMKNDPNVWGTFLWVMFDFASNNRNEGSNPGVNDKGLVTEDRKIKKDAFFFYKANWNPEPMVYLTARRLTPRKEAQTEVKAYSNCGEVELTVNGQRVGTAKPDDVKICRWPGVTLKPGVNRVEVVTHADGKEVRDGCEWTLEPGASAPAASVNP